MILTKTAHPNVQYIFGVVTTSCILLKAFQFLSGKIKENLLRARNERQIAFQKALRDLAQHQRDQYEKEEKVIEVKFLSDHAIFRNSKSSEVLLNMLDPIAKFINEAQVSLDFSCYLITDFTIIAAMVDAKARGVKVRLITDHQSGIVNNKFAKNLYDAGVRIYTKRDDPSVSIMHNKFIIRDRSALIHSTMNFTRNTSKGSHDAILFIYDKYMVQQYIDYFEEQMYIQLEPN